MPRILQRIRRNTRQDLINSDVPRAQSLVMQYGWNVVAYQILNPGISHWFSAAGDAVVGYVKRGRYYVVAGAPVCDASRIGEVVTEFELTVQADGCHACYFGAGVRLYDNCRHPPAHSVIALGAQPVWLPSEWTSMLERRPSVRAQISRARNKGIAVSEWSGEQIHSDPRIRQCLDQWLASRPMPAMHFLVEPETLNLLEDRRVFVAVNSDVECRVSSAPVAFLVASPIPARNGWLIEQIIRSDYSPNGTSELLIDSAVRALDASGASYVTLGLVPLARNAIPKSLTRNPLWLRVLLGWVRAHGRRFYNFDGLETFKSKFSPTEWEPIFAITNERNFSLKALYAIAAAFSDSASPVRHGIRTLSAAAREEWRRVQNLL